MNRREKQELDAYIERDQPLDEEESVSLHKSVPQREIFSMFDLADSLRQFAVEVWNMKALLNDIEDGLEKLIARQRTGKTLMDASRSYIKAVKRELESVLTIVEGELEL